jgi:predicted Rossmann fold nucleotide-binding protein DprA/Smf involved in DNA uptake
MQKGVQVSVAEICELLGIDTDKFEVECEWDEKNQTLGLSYEETLQKKEVFFASVREPEKKGIPKDVLEQLDDKDKKPKRKKEWAKRVPDNEFIALYKKHKGDQEAIAEETGFAVQSVYNRINKLESKGLIE